MPGSPWRPEETGALDQVRSAGHAWFRQTQQLVHDFLQVGPFLRPHAPATAGIIQNPGGGYVVAVKDKERVCVLLAAATSCNANRFVAFHHHAEYPTGFPCGDE